MPTEANPKRAAALFRFLRDVWTLTRPYWSSEERWAARGLLAAIVALNLAVVFITVELTEVNPIYDVDGRTARLAAIAIYHFLAAFASRRA